MTHLWETTDLELRAEIKHWNFHSRYGMGDQCQCLIVCAEDVTFCCLCDKRKG